MVRMLIDAGAEMMNAMRCAVFERSKPMIRCLLDYGADVSSSLVIAAEHADLNAFRFLAVAEPEALQSEIIRDQSLIAAVTGGRIGILEFLLLIGANPSARSPRGPPDYEASAIHHAVRTWRGLNIVCTLVKAGGDVNAKDTEIGESPLFNAAFKRDLDIVLLLLEAGVNAQETDLQGRTPLHRAIAILKYGLVDDAADNESKKWTHVTDIVDLLLKHGADINKQDNNGWTPLHEAVQSTPKFIIQHLLDSGADSSLTCNDGTCLDIAEKRLYRLEPGHFREDICKEIVVLFT